MSVKILIVVNEPWFFISHRLPIARAAMSHGYEVHVVTRYGSDIEKIKNEGFVFHEISFARSSSHPLQEIKTIYSLIKLYKHVMPDIVHHVTIKPVMYGSFAARIVKVPYIVNAISGLGFVFISTGFIAKLRRYIVIKAYRLGLRRRNVKAIFQNDDDKEVFIKNGILTESQVALIKGSGVDLNVFLPTPEPAGLPVVVLVARMLFDKGVGEFVEAARLLQEKGVKARFQLVGDIDEGNPKMIGRQQIDTWTNLGVIEWNGYCSDIPELFSKSHIVCLPSYREGLPKALIEAAACGRAVVTTNVPGCRHAVKPNISGLLVPVRDAKALAEALERLIYDGNLRQEMGAAGRKLAEQEFDIQKIIKAHLDVYNKLDTM